MEWNQRSLVANNSPSITDHLQRQQQERLLFTSFLAIFVHALIILGIQFTLAKQGAVQPTLDVTLVSFSDSSAPEKADFLAQHNQQGSGTQEQAKLQTTDIDATFQSNKIRHIELRQAVPSGSPQAAMQKVIQTVQSQPARNSSTDSRSDLSTLPAPSTPLLLPTAELKTLEAKLDSLRQQWAKRQRVTRITAASTLSSSHAGYIHQWRHEIETMGRLHYPPEARNCRQNCRLRLLVAIYPDGSLAELTVLESSGRRSLDEAALRIVEMSVPFAPFPPAMREQTDRLEIIRTWSFTGSRYVSEIR